MKKLILTLKETFNVHDIKDYNDIEIICDDYNLIWKTVFNIRRLYPDIYIKLIKHSLGSIISTVLVLEKINGMTLIVEKKEDIRKLIELDNYLTLYDGNRWDLKIKTINDINIYYKHFKRWSL